MSILDYILPSRRRERMRREIMRELDVMRRRQDLQARSIMLRHFQSAEADSRRPYWWTASLSGDSELTGKLPMIRSRSRLMSDNDPKAVGLVHKEVTNVIGPRIRVQARVPAHVRDEYAISEDEARSIEDTAEIYFSQRVAVRGNRDFDWRRMRTWYQYTRLRMRHIVVDGGVFLRYAPSIDRSIPFKCQIIEPECIGTPPSMTTRSNIRNGLQFNEAGELIGFWVARSHPGERGSKAAGYELVLTRNELGLPQMVFHFDPTRETRLRELPVMQAVLTLMDDESDYKDSELKRKKLEADIGVFQLLKHPDQFGDMMRTDSALGQPVSASAPDQQKRGEVVWPKAQVMLLEEGEDIKVVDPSRPGSNYQMFLDSHDRDIGLGIGRSFEMVSNNYGAANFSATRVSGIEDFVENEISFELFAEGVLDADWQWAMWGLSMATGQIIFRRVAADFQRYVKPSWDPLTDAKSATERQDNGTSSLVEECARVGNDYQAVIGNRLKAEKYERDMRERMGLPLRDEGGQSIDAAIDEKVKKALAAQSPSQDQKGE